MTATLGRADLKEQWPSLSRAQKVKVAQRLYDNGMLQREIAELVGRKVGSISTLLTDPDLSKQHARRARYARPCANCGKPLDASNGTKPYGKTTGYCANCVGEHMAKWSREKIIAAFDRFNALYGRPPTVCDLSPANARQVMNKVSPSKRARYQEMIDRFHAANGTFPSNETVNYYFGSIAEALVAAGFEANPRAPHWTRESLLAAIRACARPDGSVRFSDVPLPVSGSAAYHFGSWGAARERAGLTAPRKVWTRAELIAALWLRMRPDGSGPTSKEWDRMRDERPPRCAYNKAFGSWNAAVEAAGFTPRSRGGRQNAETPVEGGGGLSLGDGRRLRQSEQSQKATAGLPSESRDQT